MESFLKQHLNDDHCFLCGAKLHDDNRTDEHVIPQWLQRDYDLWNKHLVLLNGTSIPYRQLVIPCCSNCNSGPLASMEAEVADLLTAGFRRISAKEENRLFQWCSKILYGLLHKEMTLPSCRSDKSSGRILPREFLESFTTFHHFMTSIRRPFEFIGFKPYSVFVVETLVFSERETNFDYFDFVSMGTTERVSTAMSLAVRVGHFGILCLFQDNGFQKHFFQDEADLFNGIPLHPLQFLELASKSAYKHSLLTFSPKYHSVAAADPSSKVLVMPANGPNGDVWEDWDRGHYQAVFYSLAERHGFLALLPKCGLYDGDKHYTFLYDSSGQPCSLESLAGPDKS